MDIRSRLTLLNRFTPCVAGAGLFLLLGCQTVPQSHESDDPVIRDREEVIELDMDAIPRARALALFSQAYSLELNQKHEEALKTYREALTYDADNPELYRRIALSHIRRNQTDQAIEILNELIERRPSDPNPLLWLAGIQRREQHMDAARALFEKARDLKPGDARAYLALAEIKIQDNQIDEAKHLLEKSLEAVTDVADIHRLLGSLYAEKANMETNAENRRAYIDQAIQSFESARQKRREDPTLITPLSRLYMEIQEFDKAIPLLDILRHANPRDLATLEQLVMAYTALDNRAAAIGILEHMSTLQPTNARIHAALGELYERSGQSEKALTSYRLASRASPPDATVFLRIAALHLMEEEKNEAVQTLRDGLQRLPNHRQLAELLIYALFLNEEYDAVVRNAERAKLTWQGEDVDVTLTPNFLTYYALGLLFMSEVDRAAEYFGRAFSKTPAILGLFTQSIIQQGEEEEVQRAITVIRDLKKEHPDSVSLHIHTGYLHSFLKEHADAVVAFDLAIELAEDQDVAEEYLDAAFYFWYAAAHEREGNLERAEELFYINLELAPDNPETLNYLAYMWAEQAVNLEQAYDFVIIALEARPDSGAFVDTLGWIYYQQGRYEEALAEIKRADQLMPDDPTILDHLGDVYFKLENLDNAIEKWSRSYKIDPENEDVHEKLETHGVDLATLLGSDDKDAAPDEYQDAPDEPEIDDNVPDTSPSDATEDASLDSDQNDLTDAPVNAGHR